MNEEDRLCSAESIARIDARCVRKIETGRRLPLVPAALLDADLASIGKRRNDQHDPRPKPTTINEIRKALKQ
jgi:hypothetical protein